ncbi:LysR family transcriptional regulator [Colwellia echini]|uniref:LysR family transcriptional regulator n=1 Tax=Colwellia echini TaxID=1982103 RepID=A0ABY3MZI4_9GAMM|nr:LysR family transcriptional regulator [Colwellia echini]TYK66551.1 LysR family transcriptional regulator [Colwellia echini]
MNNRTPTLRQLQILQALAEYKKISVVAEKLYISQPSVSIQLKKLSELFDITLYRVHGKSVKLTDAGLAVLEASNEMFSTLNRLSSKLDDLKGVKSGTLKLNVVSTAKYFLPLLLGSFCKKYPLVDVELNIGNRAEVLASLKENKDDFYVLSDCLDDTNISADPFLDNLLVVVAPAKHELTLQPSISLARLTHYPFIMREHGSGTRLSVDQFCHQHKISLKEKMTIESSEAIKHSVAADLGLAILSQHTLEHSSGSGLVKLNVEGFPIKSTWYLVQNKRRKQSILAKLFYDFMQNEGQTVLRKFIEKRG